jgi:predicted ABC-type ATPase
MDTENTSLKIETKPQLLVFAGPNGSGKSTIYKAHKPVGIYVNADDIKARSGSSDIEAAIEAEKLREYFLANRKNFSFETVLSTRRNVDLIRRAYNAGYNVNCIFVITASPDINLFRVRARILNGGHSVPKERIYGRYYKSVKNITEIIPYCDIFQLIDNTYLPYTIYIKDSNGHENVFENSYWSHNEIKKLLIL